MRVQVYKNLHKKCYSVRDKKTMKVIMHVNYITLNGCKLVVQKGGRAKVLREKRKNVHAYIEGDWTPNMNISNTEDMEEIYYNPYKVADWTDRRDETLTVQKCQWIVLEPKGVFYE